MWPRMAPLQIDYVLGRLLLGAGFGKLGDGRGLVGFDHLLELVFRDVCNPDRCILLVLGKSCLPCSLSSRLRTGMGARTSFRWATARRWLKPIKKLSALLVGSSTNPLRHFLKRIVARHLRITGQRGRLVSPRLALIDILAGGQIGIGCRFAVLCSRLYIFDDPTQFVAIGALVGVGRAPRVALSIQPCSSFGKKFAVAPFQQYIADEPCPIRHGRELRLVPGVHPRFTYSTQSVSDLWLKGRRLGF